MLARTINRGATAVKCAQGSRSPTDQQGNLGPCPFAKVLARVAGADGAGDGLVARRSAGLPHQASATTTLPRAGRLDSDVALRPRPYQNPVPEPTATFVSDSHVAYRRSALAGVHAPWAQDDHETAVHEALVPRAADDAACRRVASPHGHPMGDAVRERFVCPIVCRHACQTDRWRVGASLRHSFRRDARSPRVGSRQARPLAARSPARRGSLPRLETGCRS